MIDWTTDQTGSLARCVDLVGIATRFQASDRARADAIDAAIGLLPPHPGPWQLEVAFDADPAPSPHEPWTYADGEVRARWSGDDLFLGHGPFRARVGNDAAAISGEGTLARAFRQLFPYVITHLLAGRGRFLLHGGAIERDGQATLVLGGSGSGKSTLVVCALQAGWGVLGDDLVALRFGSGGSGAVEVTGVAKRVLAPIEAVHTVGLAARPVEGDPRGRWEVDVDVEAPLGAWYPVTATLLSSHGHDATTELELLPSQQLVEWLLFSFLASHEPSRLRRFLPVAAAIASHRGWVVSHSGDAERRSSETSSLLRRLPTLAAESNTNT
jgi:hypothetical protein